MHYEGERGAAFIGRHGTAYYTRRLWARVRSSERFHEFELVLGPWTAQVSVRRG